MDESLLLFQNFKKGKSLQRQNFLCIWIAPEFYLKHKIMFYIKYADSLAAVALTHWSCIQSKDTKKVQKD